MIGIYKITNTLNNKVYIGQSGRVEGRLNAHSNFAESMKHHNTELYEEMVKYGVESFKFELLEQIDISSYEEKHIQNEVRKGTQLYNKILFPTNNKGTNNPCSIFSKETLEEIISLLKENTMSNIKIAEKYDCSPATIDNINNGDRYRLEGIEYPIRKDFRSLGGETSNGAVISNEEVVKIRRRYVEESISSIYEDYKHIYKSQKSFEGMVQGKTYKNLPIYKKREKKWVYQD